MKMALSLVGLIAISACSGGTGALKSGINVSNTVSAKTNPNGPATTPQDQNFAGLLNAYREVEGVGKLGFDKRLNDTAQQYAQRMADEGFFAHESPEGTLVQDRMRANGYEPTAYAENLAKGQQSDRGVLTDWQNSPAHDAALKAGSLEDFGLGLAGTGRNTNWVLVMGTEQK